MGRPQPAARRKHKQLLDRPQAGNRKQQRRANPNRGPRLPFSLRRELGLPTHQAHHSDDDEPPVGAGLPSDVYEYEENIAPEESTKNRRYDEIDRLEYELPPDFEDEEIEEDAATGEEYEEEFQSSQRGQKVRKHFVAGSRRDVADLQSDQDWEDDDDVSKDDLNTAAAAEYAKEEEEESSQHFVKESEHETDDDADDERHRRMIKEVTRNYSKEHREKRRKVISPYSEAYPESEFNVNPPLMDDTGNRQQITVEELMTSLQGTTGFGSLRKRMQQLQKRGVPVNAPLPKVAQERLNRQAGYEKASEEISKWQEIVKRNREAPALLFTKRPELVAVSTAELASKFEPTTELEKEVASLLQDSGLVEGTKEGGDTLEFHKLTVGEVKERQERLAKMRSLLFYHEAKSKRMKKIKSKAFHRLLQKDHKTKAGLDGTNNELDPEALKAAALKQEFRRAQECMTLKHKNTSRWAKRIIKRGLKEKDEGNRDAIAEQLRAHTSLTRKMHSVNEANSSDESSGTDSDAEEAGKDPNLITKPRSRLLAKAKVETLKVLEGDAEAEIPATGLFSLPFMARAIEKKRKQAHNEAIAVLEQLEQLENVDDTAEGFPSHESIDGAGSHPGRLAFGSMAKLASVNDKPNTEENHAMHVEEGSSDDDEFGAKDMFPTFRSTAADLKRTTDDEKAVSAIMTADSLDVAASLDRAPAGERTIHSITMGNNYKGSKNAADSLDVVTSLDGAPAEQTEMHHSTIGSESENDEIAEQGFGVFTGNESQAELIQRAFAADNVEADFEQLKARALDEEVPMVEAALNLPGWGQWTSVQKKKGQPLWMLKQQEELKAKRNHALSKRKDSHLKYVIISEKMDKKAEKFLSPSLPFPYESRETFERSIRMPIGREFNTDQAFRDMIRPPVVKDAGIIIDPIKYTMSERKNQRDSGFLPDKRKKGGKRGSNGVDKQSRTDLQRLSKPQKVAI